MELKINTNICSFNTQIEFCLWRSFSLAVASPIENLPFQNHLSPAWSRVDPTYLTSSALIWIWVHIQCSFWYNYSSGLNKFLSKTEKPNLIWFLEKGDNLGKRDPNGEVDCMCHILTYASSSTIFQKHSWYVIQPYLDSGCTS